jgi:hypothetical protein
VYAVNLRSADDVHQDYWDDDSLEDEGLDHDKAHLYGVELVEACQSDTEE